MGKFYIGLDVGTDSCGIAATDENYNLIKFRGNDMWAVSLFDEAQSAKQRRVFRTARRRLWRRQQRIDLLQNLFAEEISKSDATFFLRLNNSIFNRNDKDERLCDGYCLFGDDGYTDKEFHKKYPTIYHLRKALMDGEEKEIRHFYLGLHHIIKYRGHFLFENSSTDEIKDIIPVFKDINVFIEENFDEDAFKFSDEGINEFCETFKKEDLNRKEAMKMAERVFNFTDKRQKEFVKAICGGKFDLSVLFGNPDYKDREVNKISFSEKGIDEQLPVIEEEYGDEAELIILLKKVYDWGLLVKILGNDKSISGAMVRLYEKHKSDLKLLKNFVKEFLPEEYNNIFKLNENEGKNYCNYSGISKKNGTKEYVKRCTKEDFYAFLKKKLSKLANELSENRDYVKITEDIERGDFLPRILDADNGVFPQQVNAGELKIILGKLVEAYPQFGEKDENGLSKADKTEKIFTFRIPYYVGPLTKNPNENVKSNAWIVKKSDEKIYPWNFEETVDIEKTAENFIRRMTNKCSYLDGADVLPKSSLIYSKFCVLNQLNKLTINEKAISVDLKQKIFEDIFLKEKKPTKKKLTKWLIKQGYIEKGEEPVYGGIADDFTVSMASYIVFRNIFGESNVERYADVIEDIIASHTLFTDKNLVEKRIMRKYGEIPIIKENIKAIKGLTFKDFGTLSGELLEGIYACGNDDEEEGEIPLTVMDILWETNMNLQEILNDGRYGFNKAIKEHNGERSSEFRYDDLNDFYLSPSVKRGVWRGLTMTEEYVKAVKREPDKIFVEVTRKEDKNKEVKKSRLKALQELYGSNKNYIEDYNRLINELNRKTDADLRQERLYLYFIQSGRCMYSGQQINLEDLSTDMYDVDHIIPRSLKKDDSIHNNKVLVLREYNKIKADNYPVNEMWQSRMAKWWKLLKDRGLITAEKYARLTRKDELSDDELNDFINRQLTFTSQSAHALATILKIKYPSTKVVFSKADNVSKYRDKFGLLKNREVNDLHHAKDAYLNIVVGNVFDTRFSGNPKNYMYIKENGETRRYDLTKIYYRNVEGAWEKGITKERVEKVYSKNSIRVVRMSLTGKGGFYGQTLLPKGKGTVPLKWSGALSKKDEYGGYETLNTSYFTVVESKDKKGKTIKTIEAIPVFYDRMISIGKLTIKDYLENYARLKSPEVIYPKIKIKSLLSYNGTLLYLAGTSGNRFSFHNANQFYIDKKHSDYLRIVWKARERRNDFKDKLNDESIVVATSKDGKRQDTVSKELNKEIYGIIEKQLEKPLYKGASTFGNIASYVKTGRVLFDNCNIMEQCDIISELIGFLQCKGFTANLVKIGGSANSGTLKASKNITDCEVMLINYSPAGLYKKVTVINRPDKNS